MMRISSVAYAVEEMASEEKTERASLLRQTLVHLFRRSRRTAEKYSLDGGASSQPIHLRTALRNGPLNPRQGPSRQAKNRPPAAP